MPDPLSRTIGALWSVSVIVVIKERGDQGLTYGEVCGDRAEEGRLVKDRE